MPRPVLQQAPCATALGLTPKDTIRISRGAIFSTRSSQLIVSSRENKILLGGKVQIEMVSFLEQ